MALATYADLQTSVANFLHRSDLASIIPDLITLAETRINGDLDARLQDVSATITSIANTETLALPTDVINIRTLVVQESPTRTLEYLTPDAYEQAYPWGRTGTPEVYTVIGTNLYMSPIPDSAYSIQIVYKGRIPTITSGTNYIMTSYPNVYLYATLCEAAPYMKNDERIPVWETKYKQGIDSVNKQDWFSGSTMRVRTDVRP